MNEKLLSWGKLKFDCPNCLKSKKNTVSFVFIFLCALATGFFASFVFWVIGYNFTGISLHYLELGVRLTTLMGTTAFLYWIYWQFENLVCTCDERKLES